MIRDDSYHAVEFVVGQPFDLGWATGVRNEDDTITRTCKGCGASARSPFVERPDGVLDVIPAPFEHADGCPMFERLRK